VHMHAVQHNKGRARAAVFWLYTPPDNNANVTKSQNNTFCADEAGSRAG
jgi:hypothetical protein